MSIIETNSYRAAIASAVVLAAGLALQIAAIYVRSVSANHLMTTLGKAGTFIGGTGVGIALPIYVLKRGEKDPNIYKKLIVASLIAVIAGAVLMGVNTGNPSSKIVGQSLLNISGSIFVTMLFYAMIYGSERESSADLPRPVNNPERRATPAEPIRPLKEKGQLGKPNDPYGVTQAKQRQKDLDKFRKNDHLNVRLCLFGNAITKLQSPSSEVNDGVPDEKLFAGELINAKGLIICYNGVPYTLVRNAKGHLLRLSGQTDVKAEIWDGNTWTTRKKWLPQDLDIKSFADFFNKGNKDNAEETFM